jgi:hypothetical protein
MFEKEIESHQALFDENSSKIGKTHWYIVKAFSEVYGRSNKEVEITIGDSKLPTVEPTPFGYEVGQNTIHWWVFKKETDIDQLAKRTNELLEHVQKLKEDSSQIKEKFIPKSYEALVVKIKEFIGEHTHDLDSLYAYTHWLASRDLLAPSMLFSYTVWGSTRRSDRIVTVNGDTPETDAERLNALTELVLGIRNSTNYAIQSTEWDMAQDIADSYDPEEMPARIYVDPHTLLYRTARHVLSELSTYYEFIRNSVRNIAVEIDLYKEQNRLVHNEAFWVRFITGAKADDRPESHLWDFKNTLEMWHCSADRKPLAETEFAEDIASFANADGGLLIVGITDKHPRKVVGVTDVENKINSISPILKRYIPSWIPLIHFQPIKINDDEGVERMCLLIVVSQAKHPTEVINQQGWSSYPLRMGAGKIKGRLEQIGPSKADLDIKYDNFNFVYSSLDSFANGK